MSNTPKKRPTGARKRTPTTEKKRQQANDDQSFSIRVDGQVYTLSPVDTSGLHEMKIRSTTGYSVASLINMFGHAPGADLVGIFMWAARLVAGEDVDESDLEEILADVTYDSDLEFINADEAKAEEDEDSPEA